MRRKYEKRAFPFTDKDCREAKQDENQKFTSYTDSLCGHLKLITSKYGNHTYNYYDNNVAKSIGSIFNVTVKEARDIVHNIRDNYDEFSRVRSEIKGPLSIYFKKYGPFPHEAKTEEENSEVKELKKQLAEVIAERDSYRDKLREIWEILGEK